MCKAPLASNEAQRLLALNSYGILDTVEEKDFDDLTMLAATICQVPIALISLVDGKRQWFKSHWGLEIRETPIEQSFCAHAILSTDEIMIVQDAKADERFKDNPLVTGDPDITFYAGVPLTSSEGFSLGTLCVIDPSKRELTAAQESALSIIARQVMDKLELRRKMMALEQVNIFLETSQAHSASLLSELQSSNERIHSLIEQAPVAIIVFRGKDLIIESVNPPMLELLDKKSDILNRPLLEAIPELEGQEPYNLLFNVFETGKTVFRGDTPVALERDGRIETGYFNFTYAPLIENGIVTGVIDMATDVTKQVLAQQSKQVLNERLELKNSQLENTNRELSESNAALIESQIMLSDANSKLEESERNLQTLADNISQLAWMADKNGEITWYNKRWYDYTGTSFEEVEGNGWQRAHHPDHLERVVRKFRHDIAMGEIWDDTFPLKGKDGKYRWFLSRAIPLNGDRGEVVRWFGTNTDITERKEFEQRKDDFLGVVSHELKTPITTLKANLQLLDRLRENPGSPMIARLIDSSNRSVNKINTLLDDLLNLRRFGEGQLKLEKSRFRIWEMLSVSCNHVRVAGRHDLNITGDEHLEIFADEDRIDQVVVNFVNNAVKYAPGSRKIDMMISCINDYARIAIRDFGPGIPEDQLSHVFDRYWRASHLGKTYSGLGLGLYICAEIISRHGGEIGVESELGIGSTFWFTLPLSVE